MCEFHLQRREAIVSGIAAAAMLSSDSPARAATSTGAREASQSEWYDLSHPVMPDTAAAFGRQRVAIRRLASLPAAPFNMTAIEMLCHAGTHLDAPLHFVADGRSAEAIGAPDLTGRGVVVAIEGRELAEILPEQLSRAVPAIAPGDMVFLATGWDRHYGAAAYFRHPYLSEATARWLVDRGVRLVGMDLPNPDLAAAVRPADYHWPVHKALLGAGVLIVENLTRLGPLAGRRVEIVVGALAIAGADGAPARVFARAL